MDIKLLTEVEKASIGERQPLPEKYLRLSDDEMDARIAAARATPRRPRGHSRPSLSARRGDQVRRLHRRFAEARAGGGKPRQGGVHRLLRRAFHGRERGHPSRAASEGRASRSGRGLFDGRHGRAGPARDVLARARGNGHPHGRRRGSASGPAAACPPKPWRRRAWRRRASFPSPTSIRQRRSKRSAARTAGSSARRRTRRRSWAGRGSAARSW